MNFLKCSVALMIHIRRIMFSPQAVPYSVIDRTMQIYYTVLNANIVNTSVIVVYVEYTFLVKNVPAKVKHIHKTNLSCSIG